MKHAALHAPWHTFQPGARYQIKLASRKLKRAVALFASTIVFGTVLLLGSVIVQERDSAAQRAWDATYNMAGAFEEHTRRAIDSIRASMSILKPRLAAEGADFDLVDWAAHAPEFAATMVQISYTDPAGILLNSSLDRHPSPYDLSVRDHIRVQMTGRPGLTIGKAVFGRVSKRLTIQITDRVEKPDGTLAGIIVFSVSPEYLTAPHNSMRFGRSGFIALAGADGTVRAAYTAFENPPVEHAGNFLADRTALDAPGEAGAYEGNCAFNGEAAFLSWRKVAGYPLTVIAGLGRAEVFAEADRSAWLLSVMGAAIAALTLTMTLILFREIERRVLREMALFAESRKVSRANDDLLRRHRQLLKASAELSAERERLQKANRELARAKEVAVEANQAKTSLLMNMSHEFRTPMHAILNYTKLSLRKLDCRDLEKLTKYLLHIETSGNRLLGMLNSLLDLAKLESGKFDLNFTRGDVVQILTQSFAEIDSIFEAKEIRLDFKALTSFSDGVFDCPQMMQVFINLLSNAVKFSPKQSTVTVRLDEGRLEAGRPAIYCWIADEGPGIPEGEVETVFGKFVQSSRTCNGAGGSGLGLSICRQIVNLHQGKIWATNGPAGGAVFHIVVPRDLPLKGRDGAPWKAPEKAGVSIKLSSQGSTILPGGPL